MVKIISKCICIKEMEHFNEILKGKTYTYEYVAFHNDNDEYDSYYLVYVDSGENYLDSDWYEFTTEIFESHFITISELREEKIDKILLK